MRIRQAVVAGLAACIAACGVTDTPKMSLAEARTVTGRELKPCDAAVDRLDGAVAIDDGPESVRAAQAVETECSWATRQLMAAGLPGTIYEPCKDASEAARVYAETARGFADGGGNSAVVEVQKAAGMASEARERCGVS